MGTQTGYCACSHRALNASTSVLLVRTQGTLRARMELAGRSHVERSSELAVRREVCYVGGCCVVFVRLVCHSERRQNRPGDERREYRPGTLTPHGIPPRVWDPTHGAQHGALGVLSWRSRWHIQRTHTPHSHTRVRKARARARVRMSVHCEPLPSCINASLAPH
jgi:hypothetical protein